LSLNPKRGINLSAGQGAVQPGSAKVRTPNSKKGPVHWRKPIRQRDNNGNAIGTLAKSIVRRDRENSVKRGGKMRATKVGSTRARLSIDHKTRFYTESARHPTRPSWQPHTFIYEIEKARA